MKEIIKTHREMKKRETIKTTIQNLLNNLDADIKELRIERERGIDNLELVECINEICTLPLQIEYVLRSNQMLSSESPLFDVYNMRLLDDITAGDFERVEECVEDFKHLVLGSVIKN